MKLWKWFAVVSIWGVFCGITFGQAPQTQTAPIYSVNAKYVNGSAPGYAPCGMAAASCPSTTGLNLLLGPGTPPYACSSSPYAGGTISLTASSTNYIYLNTSASCVPAEKTTAFTSSDIPIATVVTNSSGILMTCGTTSNLPCITDYRGALPAPANGGSGTVQVNGVSIGGSASNFNNALPAAGPGHANVQFATDGSGNASASVPVSATGLSLAANTNYVICCDSRNLIASSCNTSGLDRGSITSGVVSGGIATFQSTNTYGFASGPSGFVGSKLKLAGFGGSYTALNGQIVQFTSVTSSQFVAPVTGVPDGSTGTGNQFCAYNMAGLLTASPYLPTNSTVVNVSIPGETLAQVVTNYSTLIHPFAPSVTGKPATIILHAGDGEVDNCVSAVTIEGLYTTLWSDLAADSIQVAQTGILPDNATAGCTTTQKEALAAQVNTWIKAQTPAGVAQNGSESIIPAWNYFVDEFAQMSNPSNPFYYINPTGQSHLTDQGNYHYYYAVQDALLFTGEIPSPPYCDITLETACLGFSANFYNNFGNNELGVTNPNDGASWQYWTWDNSHEWINYIVGGSTPRAGEWWAGPDVHVFNSEAVNCWGSTYSVNPVGTYGICDGLDQTIAGLLDTGTSATANDRSGGRGFAYWLGPATAPTVGTACGTPTGRWVQSQDGIASYCSASTSLWTQPFSLAPSLAIGSVPIFNPVSGTAGASGITISCSLGTPYYINGSIPGSVAPTAYSTPLSPTLPATIGAACSCPACQTTIITATYPASGSFSATLINSDFESSGSSSVNNISSVTSFTVSSGDILVIVCGTSTPSLSAITATDNNTDSFATGGYNAVTGGPNSGSRQMWWVLSAHSGTPTFNCANSSSTSSSYTQIYVAQFRPSAAASLDTNLNSNQISSSSSYASSSFSTTGSGDLIVGCFDPLYGTTTGSAIIGGVTATQVGSTLCWFVNPTTPQTSITGNQTASTAGSWAGEIVAFK